MTSSFDAALPLIGEHVRAKTFTESRGWSQGYEKRAVDTFLDETAAQVDELGARLRAAQEEVQRLSQRLGALDENRRITESVNILSRAQLTADEVVARADEHSRKVMNEARAYHDEVRQLANRILEEAHHKIAEIAELTSADQEEIARQTTYLQTLRDVARTQIEAFLLGLYDRVAEEYGRAHPAAAEAATPTARPPRPPDQPGPPRDWDPDAVMPPSDAAVRTR